MNGHLLFCLLCVNLSKIEATHAPPSDEVVDLIGGFLNLKVLL